MTIIERIRKELANGDEWKDGEVEEFYCEYWITTPYYMQEQKKLVKELPEFLYYAKILGSLTDDEILAHWARYQIERSEE